MYSVMIIYTLISVALNGVGDLEKTVDSKNGGTTAIVDVFLNRKIPILNLMALALLFCAIIAMLAGIFTNLLGQTRLMCQYSRDGLFFKAF